MWLLNSSIGKKLIMSISGLFLVLFLLFHLSMNVAAVFSGEAYNMVCSLLGSNWYTKWITTPAANTRVAATAYQLEPNSEQTML